MGRPGRKEMEAMILLAVLAAGAVLIALAWDGGDNCAAWNDR